MKFHEGKRWGGADWADQQNDLLIVGAGGIGSWTALSLSRIGHDILLVDHDMVDKTNVTGGQLFRHSDVGKHKTDAVAEICDMFAGRAISSIPEKFDSSCMSAPIIICAVDNMATRKMVFEHWASKYTRTPGHLFIDGRLSMEMFEVFTIQSQKDDQISSYRGRHLFSDEEAQELSCTNKQSTFAAMGIASIITASLCNWLTNIKLGAEFRENPFYIRTTLPIFECKIRDCNSEEFSSTPVEGKIVVEKEAEKEVVEEAPKKKSKKQLAKVKID